jgi:hypothetical protein
MDDLRATGLPPLLPLTLGCVGSYGLTPEDRDAGVSAVADFLSVLASRYPHTPLRLMACDGGESGEIARAAYRTARTRALDAGLKMAKGWQFIGLAQEADGKGGVSDGDGKEIIRLPPGRDSALPDERLARYLAQHANILIALGTLHGPNADPLAAHATRLKLEGVEDPESAFAMHDCGPVWHIGSPGKAAGEWIYPAKGNSAAKAGDDPWRDFDLFN